jgi:hypothetical protein
VNVLISIRARKTWCSMVLLAMLRITLLFNYNLFGNITWPHYWNISLFNQMFSIEFNGQVSFCIQISKELLLSKDWFSNVQLLQHQFIMFWTNVKLQMLQNYMTTHGSYAMILDIHNQLFFYVGWNFVKPFQLVGSNDTKYISFIET